MSDLVSRLSAAKPSASGAASKAAKALRARGVDVIDLGPGEPDFPTPSHLISRVSVAAGSRRTLATTANGTHGLSPSVRISTATGDEILGEAVARIGDAVPRLS